MELRQLQYFIIVAQEKSFAHAANKVFLSQQAINKAIQNLESELGIKLFERSKSGLALTPYGKVLLEKAVRITAMVDDAVLSLSAQKDATRKTIRFGGSFRTFEEFDSRKLLEFHDIYPQWNLLVEESSDKTIENKVFREKLDIGCIGAIGEMTYFDYYSIKKSPTLVAVNRANPLSERASVSIRDLKNEIFIIGNSDFNASSKLIDICRENGFAPQVGYEISNIIWVRRLLEFNRGIFLCPNPVLLSQCDAIKFLELVDDPDIYHSHIIIKKNLHLKPHVEAFKKYLLNITGAVKIN